MGRKYRVRSVENIVDEFEFVKINHRKVKEIFIEDDTFTIDKNRVKLFCEELGKRELDISWSCQSRADLDYETMKAMKVAGCRLLDVGYESGSDEILKNIMKGITVSELRTFSKNAKKARLELLADFVIGFPGETKDTADETIRFIKEIKPDLLQVAVATPIPGTEFYRWSNENGFLLAEDLEASVDEKGFQKCIITYPEFTNEDIETYVGMALKGYYLSRAYILLALRNILNKNGLHELKVTTKAAKSFFKYLRTAEVRKSKQ